MTNEKMREREIERSEGKRGGKERERTTSLLHFFPSFSSLLSLQIELKQDGALLALLSLLLLSPPFRLQHRLRLSPSPDKITSENPPLQAGRPQDDEFAVPPPDDASDVDSRNLSDLENDDDDADNNNNNSGDGDAAERATSPGDTEGEDLMENMEG